MATQETPVESAPNTSPASPNLLVYFARKINEGFWKKPGYWLFAFASVLLGVGLGHIIDDPRYGTGVRDWLYQRVSDMSRPRTHSRQTVLVLLDDPEYWKGELARRRPIKRDYLADLVTKLANSGAKIVALDFQLPAQTQDGSLIEHPDYTEETKKLAKAVSGVPATCTVVLPRTVDHGQDDDHFKDEVTVYDALPVGDRVVYGAINLDFDIRRVPTVIKLDGEKHLDSFSAAIARATDPMSIDDAAPSGSGEFPYGTFLPLECFKTLSGNDVKSLSSSELQRIVGSKIVIIGCNWHETAFGRGPRVDQHDSPIGRVSGALLHANYVEALLSGATIRPLGWGIVLSVEFLVGMAAAIILGVYQERRFLLIAAIAIFLVGVAFLCWQNIGFFFEFSIPLALVIFHYGGHTIFEWYRDATKLRNQEAAKKNGTEKKTTTSTTTAAESADSSLRKTNSVEPGGAEPGRVNLESPGGAAHIGGDGFGGAASPAK